MENSKEKTKKRKFSLFCCFSTNEGGKRRRKKNNSSQNFSGSNKTNISEQNVNIKVKDFSIEENSNKLKKPKNDENSKTSSISNINKNLNNIEIIKENGSNNNQNKNSNNDINKKPSLIKYKTSNELMRNKENEEIYIMSNINDSKEKNISLNENKNYYTKSKNYFLNNSEFLDNIILTNKEDIITSTKNNNDNINTDKISFNSYKTNNINEKNNNFNETLTIIDKIKKNSNLIFQENDDTVNIYDNNSSFNGENKLEQIKIKEIKEIKNLLSYNRLKLSVKNNNNEMLQKNSIGKIRTDSILFNNNYYDNNNNSFNLNFEKQNKNSSVFIPDSKLKFDIISTFIKNNAKINNYATTISNNINKNSKSNIINNSDIKTTFPSNLKKIKYSKSLKSIKHVRMEKLGVANDYNTRTGIYSVTNFDKNINFDFNFNHNNFNKIYREENKINDKEKTISINSKNDSKNNKLNYENNNNFVAPPIIIENNLNYINEDYFNPNTIKETNNFNDEEKFIIENANSETYEQQQDNKNITQENKKNINNNNNIKNIEDKNEKEKMKEAEENIRDFEGEIEDEQDDIDEENRKINDSKSIISNYVVAPLTGIQDLRSYAPSLCSKSEYKDNISNINDLTSNKDGVIIPQVLNETEIEIMNENGKEFKSFIETPRASGTYNKRFTHKNINYNTTTSNTNIKYCSTKSANQKIKNIYDKINSKTKEIQKINEKINKIEDKIKSHEEFNKKYELWIEKEEEESVFLTNMLNFLNSNRK